MNTGNGDAFEKIGKTIRAYLTNKLNKPAVPAAAALPANAGDYVGWYEPDSPRVEMIHFLERLIGLTSIRVRDGKLVTYGLGQWNESYIPVTGGQFRQVSKKDPPAPVATLDLLPPNDEGRFLQNGIQTTMRQIPSWLGIVEILLVFFVILSILAILVYAPFWILGGLSPRRRRPAERAMRLWPLLAVFSLVAFVGIFMVCSNDLIERMGALTGWSFALCITTIAFALASVASAISIWRNPGQDVRPGVRRFSLIVTIALLIATAYLAYWGVIGLRTWA